MGELKTFSDEGKKSQASSQGLSYAIGYTCGFLIYLLTFIYGAMVMRGVSGGKNQPCSRSGYKFRKAFPVNDWKNSRHWGGRPDAVLTWIRIRYFTLYSGDQVFVPHEVLQGCLTIYNKPMPWAMHRWHNPAKLHVRFLRLNNPLRNTNWILIIGCYIFYFTGGYLFYASLICGCGISSKRGSRRKHSLFLLPITMPIIFSFIIMSIAIQDPGGSLAVWASMIPFQLANRDDGKDCLWRTDYGALLAAFAEHVSAGRRILIHYLDSRQKFTEPAFSCMVRSQRGRQCGSGRLKRKA